APEHNLSDGGAPDGAKIIRHLAEPAQSARVAGILRRVSARRRHRVLAPQFRCLCAAAEAECHRHREQEQGLRMDVELSRAIARLMTESLRLRSSENENIFRPATGQCTVPVNMVRAQKAVS